MQTPTEDRNLVSELGEREHGRSHHIWHEASPDSRDEERNREGERETDAASDGGQSPRCAWVEPQEIHEGEHGSSVRQSVEHDA